MCKQELSQIISGENLRHRCIVKAIFKRFLLPAKLIVILFILLIIPTDGISQSYSVFNFKSIVKEVKSKYKLTVKDLNHMLPLIKQENLEILVIYARFGESENGYSQALWNDIIVHRYKFETLIKGRLTKRQESVLRAVRTDMEEQILNILVEDYVNFLADSLELERFQLDRIGNLLFQEYKRKQQLVNKYLSNMTLLQTELEKINRESESKIEIILTPMQFRYYLMLSAQDEFIAE